MGSGEFYTILGGVFFYETDLVFREDGGEKRFSVARRLFLLVRFEIECSSTDAYMEVKRLMDRIDRLAVRFHKQYSGPPQNMPVSTKVK